MSEMTTEQGDLEMTSQTQERKRIEAVWWAGALIWAGLSFGADSLGILPQIGEADAWTWVFFGAGLWALLMNIFRVLSPDRLNPKTWDYLWTAILLIVGVAGFVSNVDVAFPLILVVIGVAVLANTLLRTEA